MIIAHLREALRELTSRSVNRESVGEYLLGRAKCSLRVFYVYLFVRINLEKKKEEKRHVVKHRSKRGRHLYNTTVFVCLMVRVY